MLYKYRYIVHWNIFAYTFHAEADFLQKQKFGSDRNVICYPFSYVKYLRIQGPYRGMMTQAAVVPSSDV